MTNRVTSIVCQQNEPDKFVNRTNIGVYRCFDFSKFSLIFAPGVLDIIFYVLIELEEIPAPKS